MTTLADDLAITLQQLGDLLFSQQKLDDAILCYQRVLTLKPDLAEAYYNLGHAWMARQEWDQAINCFRETVRLIPNLAAAYRNLGRALSSAGRLQDASDCYRRLLMLDPDNAIALSDLANSLNAQGRLDEAIETYQRALELKPDHFETNNNLGNALCRRGKTDEAVACFHWALEATPNNPVTLCNLGVALRSQFKLDEAIVCFCRAIELQPGFAEAFCNLGDALKCQGNTESAVDSFDRALQLKPDYFEAASNLGEMLMLQWKLDEAIRCYQRALELKPDFAEAHNNLGNAFKEQGQLERAVACYHKALRLDPKYSAAHCNLGVAAQNQGQIDDAITHFRRALQLKPDNTVVHSNLLYSLHYRDGTSLAELAQAHREFDRSHAEPLRDLPACTINLDPLRPLRLGFVSADFGRHPVGYFLINVLQHLPRQQFETICFSDRVRRDDMTERLRAAATAWRDVRHLNDERLAQQIQADRVDILFDLSGHTSGNRLLAFARKPAPIQITWAGYVGTTGLKQMDYILADQFEIPVGNEQHYQERVLRMPDGYVCYAPPIVTPTVGPLPALQNGHITFGCFNNPAKITPRTTDVWIEILQRLPESHLILKYRGWNDQSVAERFLARFAPVIDSRRITLLGQSSHLELLSEYNRVDLALDPFPYSGGLTTCEALWMGAPVITCPGETFASRHSLSHLSNIGFTETIALNLDEYVDLAVSLGSDFSHLAELRAGLRERMAASPLCDGQRFAANLARILRQVWNEIAANSTRVAA